MRCFVAFKASENFFEGVATLQMYLEASLGPSLSAETNYKVIRYVEVILTSKI